MVIGTVTSGDFNTLLAITSVMSASETEAMSPNARVARSVSTRIRASLTTSLDLFQNRQTHLP